MTGNDSDVFGMTRCNMTERSSDRASRARSDSGDALPNRLDHAVGEEIDFIDRRVDVGRDSHALELVVHHRRGDDVVLREQPPAELGHVESVDAEHTDRAMRVRADRRDHRGPTARSEYLIGPPISKVPEPRD